MLMDWWEQGKFYLREVSRTYERQKVPIASQVLHIAIIRIKFILTLLFKWCKSPAQTCAFEREWLGRGSLGHLEGSELVFSF